MTRKLISLSGLAVCAAIILFSMMTGGKAASSDKNLLPTPGAGNPAAPLELSADFLQKPLIENGVYTFGPYDTFSGALRYLGTPPEAITDLVKNIGAKCELDRIIKGQRMNYELVEGLGLVKLTSSCGTTMRLHVQIEEGQAHINIEEIPYQTRERVYACVVKKNSSLIGSASEVGLTENQVMEAAQAFRSDIDFNNDIQPGDQLKVLVSEVQDMQGNTLAPGNVLAMEIILRDKEYWAIKYNGPDGKGFFDSKGRSLVKTFLRSPLPFLSVSSGFAFQRFHPILGKVRPHLGVDFRAPTGTPVMSAAAGRVIEAGTENGYGNVIKIRHSGLMTLYGHLSRIKVRKGQVVRQGQVIGAVGATGLATGPHLHYGMYRNDVAIDPMTVKMDTGAVLSSKSFKAIRDHAVEVIRATQPRNN